MFVRSAAAGKTPQEPEGNGRIHSLDGCVTLPGVRISAAIRRSGYSTPRLCLWCNTLDFAGCPSKSGVVRIASRHPAMAQIAVHNSRCRSPLHRPQDARETARAHDAPASHAHVSAAAVFFLPCLGKVCHSDLSPLWPLFSYCLCLSNIFGPVGVKSR